MADTLPEFREGDDPPGASYFNTVRRLIYRALRIGVADGSGLEVSQGSDGTVIGGGLAGGTGSAWRWATIPAGAAVAPGASVTITYRHGGGTATAVNTWGTPIPYSASPRTCRVEVDETGVLCILAWDC